MKHCLATAAFLSVLVPGVAQAQSRGELDGLIEAHARAQNVPSWVVHRVVKRESNYNPRARGGSALGLMQIKHPTARGVGYRGDAAGLYDASTNLKYGVAYLAGAWRLAGGDYDTCYRHYQRGYYYSAKQARLAPVVGKDPVMAVAAAPAAQSSFSFAKLFGLRQDAAPAAAAPAGGTQALAYAATPGAQPASAAPSAQADLVEVPVPPRRPAASRRAPTRIAVARKQPAQAAPVQTAATPAPAAAPEQAAAQTQTAAATPAPATAPAPAAAPSQPASMFATALPAPAPVKAPVQEASAAAH